MLMHKVFCAITKQSSVTGYFEHWLCERHLGSHPPVVNSRRRLTERWRKEGSQVTFVDRSSYYST